MKSILKIIWKTKINFLLRERFLFLKQKSVFLFMETYLFKIPKNLIALVFCFFLPRQILKNIDTGVFPSTLSYHCFCVPNWVCKRLKTFSYTEDMKKSAGGLQSTVSPWVGPGQRPGGGPRGEALGSSVYLGFENLLL